MIDQHERLRGHRIRPEPGRKYFNHMAKHTRGEWHRHMLLSSGQYIKTSDPDTRKGYGWAAVGEAGPELINFRPHHKGTAIGMGDEHWPGCGCGCE
ncbi:hypothetical protein [Brevibacterium sp. FAM 24630]|uniref:hypothetical protein n=1 Tax=Brevibacterium sp. FAM 24630 TaxID=3415680 RepID=UPI003C7D4361